MWVRTVNTRGRRRIKQIRSNDATKLGTRSKKIKKKIYVYSKNIADLSETHIKGSLFL